VLISPFREDATMKTLEETNAYCHKQAAACHGAATASSSLEVRRAFLELEQGWLHLVASGPDEPTAGEEVAQQNRSHRHRSTRARSR
jgi:hypothetical protein